jgi:hypothetical protein
MGIGIEQFKRTCTIEIGAPPNIVRVASNTGEDHLRVAFKIERDNQRFPNNAEVAIYNLNPTTRGRLLLPGPTGEITCRISAGYGDRPYQIFFGVLRRGRIERAGTDVVFRASAGDGEKAQPKEINKHFTKGTPVVAVLQAMIAASGLKPGNVAEVSDARLKYGSVLTRDLTIAGPVTEELEAFCRSLGLTWSIQDQAFQFLRVVTPYTLTQGPLVSPATGLIGTPRQDVDKEGKTKIVGQALLLPTLLPGKRFVLQSQDVNGVFVAKKTRHSGDMAGNDWFVHFEAEALA